MNNETMQAILQLAPMAIALTVVVIAVVLIIISDIRRNKSLKELEKMSRGYQPRKSNCQQGTPPNKP